MIEQLTMSAVIGAALVDSVNPCAFAVLIVLMSTVLMAENAKKALSFGISFTTAIYISYFLIGLGLYTAVQTVGISKIFYIIVTVVAFIIGIINIKEYFWYGKFISFSKECIKGVVWKRILAGVTSPFSALMIGFIVSLIELPCTGGPYLVILGLLAENTTRFYGVLYLLLYNFIFVFPLILLTGVIHYGLSSTEKIDKLLKEKVKLLHLVAGIVMILIGIAMTLSIYYGWV